MRHIGNAERKAGLGVAASNCVSERGHGASIADLQTFGTIDLQHMAARGQSETNNDFGREVELMVGGRTAKKEKTTRGVGGSHLLPPELQRTAILSSKYHLKDHCDDFKRAMKDQLETHRTKEEDSMKEALEKSKEDYIDAVALFAQYHSRRCWKTKTIAESTYSELTSESARLDAVKVCYMNRMICNLMFNNSN